MITAIRTAFAPGQYAENSYGNYIEVQSTVNGQVVHLKYNHLDEVSSDLQEGSQVTQGSQIGTTGTTGNAASPGVIPHLHLQAKDAQGNPIDPQPIIRTQFDKTTGRGNRPC